MLSLFGIPSLGWYGLLIWIMLCDFDAVTSQMNVGIWIPPPRTMDTNRANGMCGGNNWDTLNTLNDAPKTALYVGTNPIGITTQNWPDAVIEFRLFRYVTNGTVSAGTFAGTSLYYESPSTALLLTTLTSPPLPTNYPTPVNNDGVPQPSGVIYQMILNVDVPQVSCTPFCTLQMKATMHGQTFVSCSDVLVLPRNPVCKYVTVHAEDCCPLSITTFENRLSSLFSKDGWTGKLFPDYPSASWQFLSNTWSIQQAPYTYNVNPLTNEYSVKLCIYDTYNRTATSMMQRLMSQQQALSSALASDSSPNLVLAFTDRPNTYIGYNHATYTSHMNAIMIVMTTIVMAFIMV